jgi:hypothetical protein
MEKLQPGEQDAILPAESIKADVVLLGEKPARRVSADRGLRITGTLGILSEAAAQGLVDRLRRNDLPVPLPASEGAERFDETVLLAPERCRCRGQNTGLSEYRIKRYPQKPEDRGTTEQESTPHEVRPVEHLTPIAGACLNRHQ